MAEEKNITLDRYQYASITFEVEGEDLEGLGIRWVLSVSAGRAPLELKTEDDMSVSGAEARIDFTPSDTDRAGQYYYELWIEWEPDQWVKQFSGNFTFNQSNNYEE